jgi:hypothetical protein
VVQIQNLTLRHHNAFWCGVALAKDPAQRAGRGDRRLELYSPYEGLIRVSDAPLRAALTHLGQ